MAFLSINEATKHFKVSRPTLRKHLENGKVSGEKDEKGQWRIDKSELARAYEAKSVAMESGKGVSGQVANAFHVKNNDLPPSAKSPKGADKAQADETELMELRRQLAEAEKRAAVAEAQAEEKERFIEELRKDKDEMRRLLPSPGDAPKKGRSWWRW